MPEHQQHLLLIDGANSLRNIENVLEFFEQTMSVLSTIIQNTSFGFQIKIDIVLLPEAHSI